MRIRIDDPHDPAERPPVPSAVFDGTIMFDDTDEPYPPKEAVRLDDGALVSSMAAWAVDVDTVDEVLALLDDERGAALQISRDWIGHREFLIDMTVTSV